jgi:tRNA(Ile)-lysidine synthase
MLRIEDLKPNKYLLAISGGVDSMVLLDLLSKQKDLTLVIAHFDHGIRTESQTDRLLVEKAAEQYGLPFVYSEGHLDNNVSESIARDARYSFLFTEMKKQKAKAIVTAHHKGDKLETAVLNLLRGTGRKGLTSLRSSDIIKRPMLSISKDEIYNYARQNKITWHEDLTNQDTKYKRNFVRKEVLNKFSKDDLAKLNSIIEKTNTTNKLLDKHLSVLLDLISTSKTEINRSAFASLEHKLSLEVMASWLRRNSIREFTSKQLDSLVILGKTLRSGQQTDVNANYVLRVKGELLALVPREC